MKAFLRPTLLGLSALFAVSTMAQHKASEAYIPPARQAVRDAFLAEMNGLLGHHKAKWNTSRLLEIFKAKTTTVAASGPLTTKAFGEQENVTITITRSGPNPYKFVIKGENLKAGRVPLPSKRISVEIDQNASDDQAKAKLAEAVGKIKKIIGKKSILSELVPSANASVRGGEELERMMEISAYMAVYATFAPRLRSEAEEAAWDKTFTQAIRSVR